MKRAKLAISVTLKFEFPNCENLIDWSVNIFAQYGPIQPISLKGGGGSGLSLWKKYFELGVGWEGHDTSQHFEGSFGSISAIQPMWGLGAKTMAKTKI